jgi:DNA-binding phage protein
VIISPGVTTGELMKLFMDKKVCFKTDVIAQNFTYGGVLATGSHGTGRDQPIMSDFVTRMKLVGPDGETRTFPNDFKGVKLPKGVTVDDAMNALRVHLGVFGVVVEITLKVEPMVSSEVRNYYPQVGQLFYGPNPEIKKIVKENWSVQILWFPFNSLGLIAGLIQGLPFTNIWQPRTDEVWMHTVNIVDTYAETNRWDKLQLKVQDTVQSVFAGELGSPLIGRYPFLVPAYLAAGFKIIKHANPEGKPQLEQLPYAIHFRYGLKYATVYDMEFAFPVDFNREDGFDVVLKAVDVVIKAIAEAAKPGFLTIKDFPLSSAIDMRFIKKSKCLLCPATAMAGDTSTHTAYIEILSFVGTETYRDFFKEIAKEWMKLGGVPHWAKQWSFLKDEGIYKHLRDHYGPNMKTFTAVLEALNGQKKDIFLNKTMTTLLYD